MIYQLQFYQQYRPEVNKHNSNGWAAHPKLGEDDVTRNEQDMLYITFSPWDDFNVTLLLFSVDFINFWRYTVLKVKF